LITILDEDVKAGHMHSSPLKAGMQVQRGTLIELALISSDNIAAIALGRTEAPMPTLPPNTTIVEASGLNAGNRSTAREIATIARALYDTNLAATSVKQSVTYNARERHSTNPFIGKPGWTFFLSKTGFTNPAGGCLVVITQVRDQLLTIVILGAKDARQRWLDLVELRKELGDSDFYMPTTKVAKTKNKRKKTKA
jgi:D-alanyl-D-alanine carboxypeptidase